MISQIVAHSSNHVIGKNNKLPWHYPEDLKHFKNITTGKTIVMWRKTFESIGRPLPNRKNIVLTRNTDRSAEWVEVIHGIDEILSLYQQSDEELMVIWWQQIYELLLPYTDKLYITHVHCQIDWDAFYPQYAEKFLETSRIAWDEYDFVEYKRVQYGAPKVGIWIAVMKDWKMLFGKRKSDHAHWVRSRPGGKLDGWEARAECAARETFEETWLSIKNIQLITTTNDIYPNEWRHFVSIWMKSDYAWWELTLMEPDKFEKREWFDIDNLPTPIFRWVPEVIAKYF